MSAAEPPLIPARRAVRVHLYGAAAAAVASAIVLLFFTPFALSVRAGRPVPHPIGIAVVIALLGAAVLVARCRSRVAALALASYFLVNQVVAAPWRAGAGGIVAALVLAYLYAGGIWASFTWHHGAAASRRTRVDAPPR